MRTVYGVNIVLMCGLAAPLYLLAGRTDQAADEFVPPRGYVCYRTSNPPRIDGKLDDAAWQAVPWTQDFQDIEGPKKPKPRLRTRAKMLWDEQYFYVGAELEEPHVWATLTEHDSVIFNDNDFEVFIDPNSDSHEYCEFEINALNTGWDLLLTRPYKDGGRAINSWEIPGLKTAVHVDGTLNDPRDRDKGWTVEIAFPWKVLAELANKPAPPHDGDQWRLNFSRVEWTVQVVNGKYHKIPGKHEDNWVWSPQGVIDMHRPETWGYVQFSTAPPGSVKFRPDPSGPVRHLLHRIYYAQREYHKEHGRWAQNLRDLGLEDARAQALTGKPLIETTSSGFEATAAYSPGDRFSGSLPRLHIREDSRIWEDTADQKKQE
jgi:Carbohydrate family 9 binding domain-like